MKLRSVISIVFNLRSNILALIKLFLLNILLYMISFNCIGQVQAKITQPELDLIDNNLIIKYDILDADPKDIFDIRLEITDNTGAKLNAVALTGDIGDTIKGGTNKQIIWNLLADSAFLNTSINVEIIAKKIIILETITPEEVLAEKAANEGIEEENIPEMQDDQSKKENELTEIPVNESNENKDLAETTTDLANKEEDLSKMHDDDVTKEDISTEEKDNKMIEEPVITSPKVKAGMHILQSTIFPGWGLSKLTDGKPYWLIGVAGTGCLASSIYLNRQAYSNYNNYLDSKDRREYDTYFDKAKSQENISKALAITAAAIWIADIAIVGIKASKMNKSYRKSNVSAFSLGSYFEPNTDTPMLSLYLNF